MKVIVVKMVEPTGVKMAHVIQQGSLPKLKEYIILAGKSGIRGLQVERVGKSGWDEEYRTIIGNATRGELQTLKAVVRNEQRTAAEVRVADTICAKFVFESVDTVCGREAGTTQGEVWLQENAWRIVRTCATSTGAKRIADKKRQTRSIRAGAFTIETPQRKMYVIKADYEPRYAQPRMRVLFADDYLTVHPGDFWQDIKTTGLGDEGGVDFTNGKKPEALLKRIIGMTTQPGDWVIDAFAGSGTTGAVAHKMGRRWIMIEVGEQCRTHILPRLRRVTNGTDKGGSAKLLAGKGVGDFVTSALALPGRRRGLS